MKFLKILIGIVPILVLLFMSLICDIFLYIALYAEYCGDEVNDLIEKIRCWIDE